ncbi:MAG: hypothetical protein JWM91_4173 [Rhodospirillales bacterium]|nr:hypothetical protein [Rhodospirillales bacterium]
MIGKRLGLFDEGRVDQIARFGELDELGRRAKPSIGWRHRANTSTPTNSARGKVIFGCVASV